MSTPGFSFADVRKQADRDQRIVDLEAELRRLQAVVAEQAQRIRALEAQLAEDPRISPRLQFFGAPPSSAPPKLMTPAELWPSQSATAPALFGSTSNSAPPRVFFGGTSNSAPAPYFAGGFRGSPNVFGESF